MQTSLHGASLDALALLCSDMGKGTRCGMLRLQRVKMCSHVQTGWTAVTVVSIAANDHLPVMWVPAVLQSAGTHRVAQNKVIPAANMK